MKRDFYAEITDKIVHLMEKEGLKWSKPWVSTGRNGQAINVVSKKPYRGINTMLLAIAAFEGGYSHPIWATFKQWSDKGGKIRKGEKSTTIVFYKPIVIKEVDENTGESSDKNIRMMRTYNVFNIAQVDCVELPESKPLPGKAELIAGIDDYIENTGVHISEDESRDMAAYTPALDLIIMPNRKAFKDTVGRYSTLFHELGHWTGHKTRLDRLNDNSKAGYAYEELIAELSAAYQCIAHGLDHEPRQDHAAYLQSWLKALKDDKRLIFKAAAAAQKAVLFCDDLQPDNIAA